MSIDSVTTAIEELEYYAAHEIDDSLGEGYWGDYNPDKSLWRLDLQYSEDPNDMDTVCTILPTDTSEPAGIL